MLGDCASLGSRTDPSAEIIQDVLLFLLGWLVLQVGLEREPLIVVQAKPASEFFYVIEFGLRQMGICPCRCNQDLQ